MYIETPKKPKPIEELFVNPHAPPEISLPESIYTACLLMPAAFNGHEYSCCWGDKKPLAMVLQVYLLFVCNTMVQAGFAWYIRKMFKEQLDDTDADTDNHKGYDTCAYDKSEEQYKANWYLRLLCTAAYVSFCIQDLFQTMWMMAWLYYVPSCDKLEKIRVGTDDESGRNEITNGIPFWLKFINSIIIFVPKIGIAG
eukprot:UN26695